MKKFRRGMITVAIVIIIAQLILIDYSNLSWSNNAGGYLGIFSMILLINMGLLSRYERKGNKK